MKIRINRNKNYHKLPFANHIFLERKYYKLPGDKTQKQFIKELIRVDHAGEYGAKAIYEGQLKALKKTAFAQEIENMKEQELQHLKYFEEKMLEHKARPSALLPFWKISGFLLGYLPSKIAPKASMIVTEAIEEEIDKHYQKQIQEIEALDNKDPEILELKEKIEQFRKEEIEHRDIAKNHFKEKSLLAKLFNNAIRTSCKLAIAIAKKI